MEIKFQTQNLDYARALRAIGQDLARLLPVSLEIEVIGQDFIARGQGMAERFEETDDVNEGALRKTWNKLLRRTPEPEAARPERSSVPFERGYSPEEINRLDEIGISRRRGMSKNPDTYTLGERLRAIGRIVNSKGGQLVKLTTDVHAVTFQYRDEKGEIHSEEYSTFDLYKIQQEYYAERGTFKPKDPWRGFDR
jgi:hypothetical protein